MLLVLVNPLLPLVLNLLVVVLFVVKTTILVKKHGVPPHLKKSSANAALEGGNDESTSAVTPSFT
jgi:hypothetical protein